MRECRGARVLGCVGERFTEKRREQIYSSAGDKYRVTLINIRGSSECEQRACRIRAAVGQLGVA